MNRFHITLNSATQSAIENIARETGESLHRVIEVAIDRYRRDLFLGSLNRDFEALKENAPEWEKELEERSLWDSTISD